MNTADRSIALVDHALRRRFHFYDLHPDPEILRRFLQARAPQMEWAADLFEKANTRLEQDNIGRDFHIGHSHLMRADLNDDVLRLVWECSILPMLRELFHNHPEEVKRYELETLNKAPKEAKA